MVLVLASGVVTARFIGHAAETSPGIHVDSTPINRDPQSGQQLFPGHQKSRAECRQHLFLPDCPAAGLSTP